MPIAFYRTLCGSQNRYRKICWQEYLQHIPHVRDGTQGFINYFERMAIE